jgi:hypothetical protein
MSNIQRNEQNYRERAQRRIGNEEEKKEEP